MLESLFSQFSYLQLGLFLCIGYALLRYTRTARMESRIRSLGGMAPIRLGWLPGNIDMMYNTFMHFLRHEALQFWTRTFKTFGNPNNPWTVEARLGGQRAIITADPENIKAILATQFQDYGKGERFNKDWHEFLGDSIFTTDGQKWHNSRQLIRPLFIKDRLSDIKIFEKHVQVLLPLFGGNGETIEVCDLFFQYTLDAATDFLLGKSVDSLGHLQTDFATAFNYVQGIQSIITRSGPLNWLVSRKKFRKELKVMNEFTNQYIEAALRLSPEELEKKTKTEEGYTFLHALASYNRDRTFLRDQIVAVLLAGRDTTACTLSWLFYELARKPEVVTKLRKEIINSVGAESLPSYDDLKSMKYLQHCLNEILRLYPIVPFNLRQALKDTTLPHGAGPDGNQPVGVLKNTRIGYSTLVMQRREDIYPSVASGFPPVNEFVPERWEEWTPKPWTYIPFNGGPRLCVGQQFALTELAYTVVRILQNFDRIENRMTEESKLKTDIVLQPANGVQVGFYRAKK